MSDGPLSRFDLREIPRTTAALYAGGIMLAAAGVVSALIWYTGTLEPTPDEVGSAVTPVPPPAVTAVTTTAISTPAVPVTPDTTSAPRRLIVANTGGLGAVIRSEPTTDAKVVAGAPEGTTLEVIGPDVQAEGRTWRNVRDAQDNKGFIAGELVRTAP